MRTWIFPLRTLVASLVVASALGCGTGCPTPVDCSDVLCGCLPRLALRPDPNAAELARELPLETSQMSIEVQRW